MLSLTELHTKDYITGMAQSTLHIPVSSDLKTTLEQRATREGYRSVEDFLRDLLDRDDMSIFPLPDEEALAVISQHLEESKASSGRDARKVLEEIRQQHGIPTDS